MKKINIFCFGFGQVAKNFIYKLKTENFNINLSTTSRDETKQKQIYNINYNSYQLKDENYDPNLIKEHYNETNSNLSKKIMDNFDKEIYNFVQVCPKEMLNKLENPINDKINIKEVS